ncbi:YidC/Oxa1 family membrane protein insertase [Alicyclobacillus mengziensis]|uniref:Membrane protein insertase YidC n=1 Tax=Alicyclobacillus mengziensis TaxID=2931921 RepID=A0A9X7Z8Q1_9BACL|nr:YidC/Oxa1 family membrane protein insertase [Alicyclobacillus mengziensis]QSO48481.1 membrane protein insertase YidC [Alicyclobacillus mengziensis]
MYANIEQVLHATLSALAGFTHDWGLAIVLFTIGIRLLLVPLSIKVAKSSIAQASIADKVAELQKSWTGSKSDLMQAQQKLMREHGVKPLSSLSLILVQSPVFFVLYRLFQYLDHPAMTVLIPWVPYLTVADPFHIVPIVAGVLMALSTFVTYSQAHVGNAQIMSAIVGCTVTMIVLWGAPIAVALYYTTSGVWGILERFIYKKLFVPRKTVTSV